MKRKELMLKSYMMIANWKNPFDLHGLYKTFQRGEG